MRSETANVARSILPPSSRHCPRWIRTTILGSKDRCPAIGRGGSEPLKLPIDGHSFNSIAGPRGDDAHIAVESASTRRRAASSKTPNTVDPDPASRAIDAPAAPESLRERGDHRGAAGDDGLKVVVGRRGRVFPRRHRFGETACAASGTAPRGPRRARRRRRRSRSRTAAPRARRRAARAPRIGIRRSPRPHAERHRTLDGHERDVGAERRGELHEAGGRVGAGESASSARRTAPASALPPPSPAPAGIRFIDLDRETRRPSRRVRVGHRGAVREVLLGGPESGGGQRGPAHSRACGPAPRERVTSSARSMRRNTSRASGSRSAPARARRGKG